jgi:hypothetical protein
VIAGGATDALTINSSGVAVFANTISGSITGNSATANQVNHTVTFAATGGAAAGAAFDGSAAKIIDYHTVGAQVAGTYVTSVSGAGVISVTSGTTPQVSISQATSSTNGYLSSTDWTTFNNKTSNTGTVTSVGGTGTVSGLTLSGSVTSSGNLTLGGTLSLTSGNVTTALGFTPYSNTNPAGYTTNTGTVTSVAALTLTTTGTDITSTVANGTTTPVITLNVPTASASNRGLLSSTDWTTFNNKTSNTGTVTSIAASTTPVNGLSLSGGTITTSGTIAITGTLSGIVNSNLSGTAGITNANLANSTISGVSLGGSLYNLTAGTNITFSSGTTYNGSAAITINADSYGVGGNQLVYVLNGVLSLASAKNTLASLFGLTSGVTLQSNTRYQYELVFNLQASKTGVLSYALALGSGVAVAQHNYSFEGNATTTISGYTAGVSLMSLNATGAAITSAQTVADTLNGYAHYIVSGTIDVTTGGSVNFMISQDQNTPITWSVKAGAYIKLTPLGAIGANTAAGTWA